MKLFISHSGDRSRELADELYTFIKTLLRLIVEPWISTGIDKGSQ
jgi:hypothetical protein